MINIERQYDIYDVCKICKLDRENICDYSCIRKRENFMFRFFTCPKFIFDNKNPITNAELLSTDLKDDLKSVVNLLWGKLVENNKFNTVEEFQEWLQKSSYLN